MDWEKRLKARRFGPGKIKIAGESWVIIRIRLPRCRWRHTPCRQNENAFLTREYDHCLLRYRIELRIYRSYLRRFGSRAEFLLRLEALRVRCTLHSNQPSGQSSHTLQSCSYEEIFH